MPETKKLTTAPMRCSISELFKLHYNAGGKYIPWSFYDSVCVFTDRGVIDKIISKLSSVSNIEASAKLSKCRESPLPHALNMWEKYEPHHIDMLIEDLKKMKTFVGPDKGPKIIHVGIDMVTAKALLKFAGIRDADTWSVRSMCLKGARLEAATGKLMHYLLYSVIRPYAVSNPHLSEEGRRLFKDLSEGILWHKLTFSKAREGEVPADLVYLLDLGMYEATKRQEFPSILATPSREAPKDAPLLVLECKADDMYNAYGYGKYRTTRVGDLRGDTWKISRRWVLNQALSYGRDAMSTSGRNVIMKKNIRPFLMGCVITGGNIEENARNELLKNGIRVVNFCELGKSVESALSGLSNEERRVYFLAIKSGVPALHVHWIVNKIRPKVVEQLETLFKLDEPSTAYVALLREYAKKGDKMYLKEGLGNLLSAATFSTFSEMLGEMIAELNREKEKVKDFGITLTKRFVIYYSLRKLLQIEKIPIRPDMLYYKLFERPSVLGRRQSMYFLGCIYSAISERVSPADIRGVLSGIKNDYRNPLQKSECCLRDYPLEDYIMSVLRVGKESAKAIKNILIRKTIPKKSVALPPQLLRLYEFAGQIETMRMPKYVDYFLWDIPPNESAEWSFWTKLKKNMCKSALFKDFVEKIEKEEMYRSALMRILGKKYKTSI